MKEGWGGICWYCHWGWPKQVADIYKHYEELAGYMGLHYGPGHIVWEDENFEDHNVQWCINHDRSEYKDLSDLQFNAAIESLKKLLEIPESVRCCEPKEYNGWNPENFPPPANLEMMPRC